MKLFFLSLLLVVSTSLGAVTITWIGGSGNWNVPANWSTGTIPTSADNVLLGSGNKVVIPNFYAAFASKVEVGAGTLFGIGRGASISITPTFDYALENQGKISCNGLISIDGALIGIDNLASAVISTTPRADIVITDSSLGIQNSGIINNGADITMTNMATYFGASGIRNIGSGSFTNNRYGDIDFSSTSATCIDNEADFVNDGRINLNNNINGGLAAVLNFGDLINSGTINFYNFSDTGIQNSADFTNAGTISFPGGSEIGIAINNSFGGTFVNRSGASIEIDQDNISTGISSGTPGFYNYGGISIAMQQGQALTCGGTQLFQNNANATIVITGAPDDAIKTFSGGLVLNDGGLIDIDISSGNSYASNGNGTLENINCGAFIISGPIDQEASSGLLLNEAWMQINDFGGSHDIDATFDNYGVIEDRHASLSVGDVNNQGVIIQPLAGVTEGVAVPNALWIGPAAGITIPSSWTKGSGGSSLGTYDQASNTFTAASGTEGNTQATMEFFIAGCDPIEYIIDFPGGIIDPSPLQYFPELNLGQGTSSTREEVAVYPNPAIDQFSINLPIDLDGAFEVLLYDLVGQKLMHQRFDQLARGTIRIDRPKNLAQGTYFLELRNKHGWSHREKLILQ